MKNVLMVVVGGLAVLLASGSSVGADLRTVAFENQSAPGGPPNNRFDLFGTVFGAADPAFNAAGQAAFPGAMNQFFGGVTSSTDSGIWSEGHGSLSLLAREGNQAPGLPAGAVFNSFDSALVINDVGQTAFTGYLRQGVGGVVATNDSGIWSEGNGPLSLVAREGFQAPGTPDGALFSEFQNTNIGLVLNNAGQSAFYGRLSTAQGGVTLDDNTGVWAVGSGGVLGLVAREGSQPPGTPAGAKYGEFLGSGFGVTINDMGRIAFRNLMVVGQGGVTSSNDTGIWTNILGSLALFVREGDAAPNISGAVFDGFGEPPGFNDSSHLLLRGFLRQGTGGVTAANDEGLWSTRSGPLSLVARAGDQAPGTPAGAKFDQFVWYNLNNNDQFVTLAYLRTGSGGVDDSNDVGIWSDVSGELTLIAREGNQAPGTSDGTLFNTVGGRAVLNPAGQVAFQGSLQVGSGDVTSANDVGIWAQDTNGALQLIIREGDSIEITPGTFRTVTALRFLSSSGGSDGRRTQISDSGEILFWANTNNGEGLFVSSRVAATSLPGDFNLDGIVDAADYTVWRDGLGSVYSASDYDTWKSHFGETSAGAASSVARFDAAVPEPTTMLLPLAAITAMPRRRFRHR
jgi:hypothetical protein